MGFRKIHLVIVRRMIAGRKSQRQGDQSETFWRWEQLKVWIKEEEMSSVGWMGQ